MSNDQKFEARKLVGSASAEKSNVRSRAQFYLRGPRIISEPGATFARLVGHYIAGETLDTPDLQKLLSNSIQTAQIEAQKRKDAATGSQRDARLFYEHSAAILQEIQAEIMSGQG